MKRMLQAIAGIVTLALLFAGCSPAEENAAAQTAAAPAQTLAQSEATPEPVSYKGDGVTVMLEPGAGIDEIMPVSDIEAIVGATGYTFKAEQGEGIGAGGLIGYYMKDAVYNTGINLILFVDADESMYDALLALAEPESVKEIGASVFEKGIVADFSDGSVGVVVKKGGTVIGFSWYPEGYAQEPAELGAKLALRLISNFYDIDTANVSVTTTQPVTPVSSVPQTLPEDLGGKTVYGYVTDLMKQYLPDDVFTGTTRSEQEKTDARAAIALILQVCNEQLYEKQDQYWLHIRGRCYAQQFFDTKDKAYKELALADYQAALDMGYIVVKGDYDRIAVADDIVFPAGWGMEQALTLDEMGALLGIPGNELMFVESSINYPPNGMPEVGYAIIDDPDARSNQIIVTADVHGGRAMYEERKAQAVDNKTEEIAGIGDAAFLCGFTDTDDANTHYTALVLLRGDIVVQIWIPTEAWTSGPYQYQADQLACGIGFQIVDNMTNPYRVLPELKLYQ